MAVALRQAAADAGAARRPAAARRRHGGRGQRALVALPRTRRAGRRTGRRPPSPHHRDRDRRQLAAVAGQPAALDIQHGTGRPRAVVRGGGVAHPHGGAAARPASGLDGAARRRRAARGARPRRADEPSGRAGPWHLHAGAGVPDVRERAAGRRRPIGRGPHASTSPGCGRGSARSPPPTRTPGSSTRSPPTEIAHADRRQPDDRVPVHEAHELQQRGRAVGGGHHVLGRAGPRRSACRRTAGCSRGPAATPTTPRSCRNRRDLHSSPAIRAGRACGARAWPASASTISPTSISTRASRARCRSRRLSSAWRSTGRSPSPAACRFAGGPWNNYVMHSIATMVERLRDDAGALGLVTANGGYVTKHAFGVYSTRPPPRRPALRVDVATGRGGCGTRPRGGRGRGMGRSRWRPAR